MDSGVKVVGATANQEPSPAEDAPLDDGTPAQDDGSGPGGHGTGRRRSPGGSRPFLAVSLLAVLGLVGSLVFGLLWGGGSSGSGPSQDPAVLSSARLFLTTFFNFTPKTVDSDFASLGSMATGAFASQSNQFFNSAIRQALEKAAAESRGQIRNIYVQSDSAGSATVYAVVDQEYANNKITTPGSDVVRILVDLKKVGSPWKISNVTVLEGATPASAGTASGSAGSTVPGQ